MKTHIETITAFIADQMSGGQVPPSNSVTMLQLSAAVAALQKSGTNADWQLLGASTLGAVIDHVRSGIGAEATLHAFLRGGNRG